METTKPVIAKDSDSSNTETPRITSIYSHLALNRSLKQQKLHWGIAGVSFDLWIRVFIYFVTCFYIEKAVLCVVEISRYLEVTFYLSG